MKRVALAAAIALASSSAFAVDFTQQIKQFDGSDLVGNDGKPTNLTLEAVAENALLGSYNDEQGLSGEDKLKRYHLALKIYDHKTNVELSVDEQALLRKLIAKSYNTLVMGRAWEMLGGPEGSK
jgi:hypothetical protein